ncbi:hypothetical protein ACQ86N_17880 [Puia sp. P3]|uniref:hypothetical protein n=1 Tax=Puia sp. P3 TaxID=3423952 RepID=UPI003D667B2A
MLGVDAYYKKSKDLIVTKNIPEEYGIPQMYMNYGSMDNYGFEGNLTITPIRRKDFSWDQTFIYSQNYNKVVQSDLKYNYADYLSGNAIVPGKPLGALYSYTFTGLSHQYGIPQYDLSGAKAGDPTSFLSYTGRRDPLIDMGTSTSIRYRALSLVADFHVVFGNHKRLNSIYNGMAGSGAGLPPSDPEPAQRAGALAGGRRGMKCHTNIPAFTNWYQQAGYVSVPTLDCVLRGFIALRHAMICPRRGSSTGSYLRCRSLSLRYTPPAAMLKGMGIKQQQHFGYRQQSIRG